MKSLELRKLIREEVRKAMKKPVNENTTKFGIEWEEDEDKPETEFFGELIQFIQANSFIYDDDWSKLKGKEEETIELIKNKITNKCP